MEEIEHESVIQWCCQNQYYNDMLSFAKQAVDAYYSNERLRIFLALAYALNNHNKEALKQAGVLESEDDFVDAPLSALIIQSFVHKTQTGTAVTGSGTTDRLLIAQIDAKIREDRRRASASTLSLAATVLLLIGKADKARDYADRACKLDPTDTFALLAKGWISLSSNNFAQDNPSQYFEAVLSENNKHFNALLGSAKSREARGDHSGAIMVVNPLVVRYPKLSIPLVEKMKNLLALKEWDQALETCNRILSFESVNIDAFRVKAIVMLCREGDYNEAVKHVQTFFRNLVAAEPKNIELFIRNVRLFSKIAMKNSLVLAELFKVTDKMSQYNAGKITLMVLLGDICSLMGKYKDAEHWYGGALRIDESAFLALVGLARCQLQESSSAGASSLAKQQLDFLIGVEPLNPELLFMSAILSQQAEPNQQQQSSILQILDKAMIAIIKEVSKLSYGVEYLTILNPDLCIDIIKEYLQNSPSMLESTWRSSDEQALPCVKLLEMVVEACPGVSEPLLLMGKLKMQAGDLNGALTVLKRLLDTIDRTNAEGHLLMARILIKQGHYESASQTLEVGLSYNFKVREDPIYHMILGSISRENGDLEGAIKNYEKAMSLAGLSGSAPASNAPEMSSSDKATLYLEMISACTRLRRFAEASALVEATRVQLAGSPEEGRAIIGHAELCLEMDDELERAIELLNEIKPGQPYYAQARTKLADVYLYKRKDRQSFAKCYRDLVENCPGPESYSMLGDAYLAIQEPERAIEAFELSLESSPADKSLVKKMGKALARTHQYAKAIAYYKEAVKRPGCRDLKLDMAELLMKLKLFDKAEEALLEELNEGRGSNDIPSLEARGKQLSLLAKVRERAGNLKGALNTLGEAKENQNRYVQRTTMLPSMLDQKGVLADICFTMAEHSSSLRLYSQAIEYYREALSYKPNDVKTLLSLAKLNMQMNELEKCTQYCQVLLNADPNNEAACVMMADLAFRKVDFETAAFHFRQLLLQKPTYWTALARLIEVSRRTGSMDDLQDWLDRAESAIKTADRGSSGKSKNSSVGKSGVAGFHYCSGLLDWRTGRLNSALRKFNAARRDPEWGQQAIYNMIEICLDPDDEMRFNEVDDDIEGIESEDDMPRNHALRTAQKLLQELNPKGSPQEMLTHRLLGNFYLLATKKKYNIERALQDCTNLASQEALRDHVGPALGLATAHILLKQSPRARNHLKRVSKNIWTFEDAEYLERCWLLLADIYLQSSKYDLAMELLKRVLQHNATCVRAHELSGLVAEKEQSYRDAANKYALAWKYGAKLNKLSVGYKLAYCSFKSKQFAEAIEACNQVLQINPDYPRIKKDILDKSINHLRT